MVQTEARQENSQKCLLIKIPRELRFNAFSDFRNAYESADQCTKVYTIDMRQTEYIDSSGLGMLLILNTYAAQHNAQVKIINCGQYVEKLLKTVAFDKEFNIENLSDLPAKREH